MLGGDRYKNKSYKITPNPKLVNALPPLSARVRSSRFPLLGSRTAWKLSSPECIALRDPPASVDYTSQNTVRPTRFRLLPRCFLGVVVSEGSGIGNVGPRGSGLTRQRTCVAQMCLVGIDTAFINREALSRPEVTFCFPLPSRLALSVATRPWEAIGCDFLWPTSGLAEVPLGSWHSLYWWVF